MIDKNELKKALSAFKPKRVLKQSQMDAAIDNLVEIGLILSDILNIEDTKTLLDGLNKIVQFSFPYPGSLQQVISGRMSGDYTKQLFAILEDTKYKPILASLLEHYDVTNPLDRMNFYSNISDLLILHIAGIEMKPDYLLDYLIISNEFRNEKTFLEEMDNLETEFKNYLDNQEPNTQNNNNKENLTLFTNKKSSNISKFFYAWAYQNKFNQDKYARLLGILKPNDFLNILSEKTIFKDIGAPITHGAYTHAIQMYIVNQLKLQNKIQHEAADLYSYLGKSECKAKNILFSWDGHSSIPVTGWDIFFDRKDELSYRTPEKVTMALFSSNNPSRWPILTENIKQQKKSKKATASNDRIIYKQYNTK